MQLSDDGNFMWNGTEWIPNPEATQATPVHNDVEADSAAAVPTSVNPGAATMVAYPMQPVAMTPMTPMTTAPSAMPMGTIQGSTTGTPAINMAAALSVFKYGILSIVGMILSFILLTIVWVLAFGVAFAGSGDDGGGVVALIITFGALLITVIGYGQIIIYPVGAALKDGRRDSVSFGYVDSWKASMAGFIESVGVTAGMGLVVGIGAFLESGVLIGLGVLAFVLFLVGYVPYMVRKTAEIMN